MATIRHIRTAAITIPLDSPIAFAHRQVTERHYLLVRLEADNGSTGIGFCYAGHAGSLVAAAVVKELLAPVVIGMDADRIAGIWQQMHQAALLQGRAGIVTRAMSAIDIALWDRQARSAGLPLWKLLGGVADEAVPAYATVTTHPTRRQMTLPRKLLDTSRPDSPPSRSRLVAWSSRRTHDASARCERRWVPRPCSCWTRTTRGRT